MSADLRNELRFFEQHRLEWSAGHSGKYAVVESNNLIGFFEDYESAFKTGLQRVGSETSFLIKQVWPTEPVFTIY